MRYGKVLIVVLLLGGCAGVGVSEFSAFSNRSPALDDLSTRNFYPNDEVLVSARTQFSQRNFGRAHRDFREAINLAPTDPAAWLGFAAASDMLGRFDDADTAYARLRPVIGNRIEFLNNYGYSQLLRGNLVAARSYFLRAYELDPTNEITANNLELLRSSVGFPRRAPGDLRGI